MYDQCAYNTEFNKYILKTISFAILHCYCFSQSIVDAFICLDVATFSFTLNATTTQINMAALSKSLVNSKPVMILPFKTLHKMKI